MKLLLISLLVLLSELLPVTSSALNWTPPDNERRSSDVDNAAALIPVSPVGPIAALQFNGDTRIYYQDSVLGGIMSLAVSNAFTTGHLIALQQIVPANEIMFGSPIALVNLPGTSSSDPFPEIHIFFVSPANILSSYIWRDSIGRFIGGSSCTECITQSGFVVQPNTKVLYALALGSGSSLILRVGFVSAGAPSTISEAVSVGGQGSGQWVLSTLQN
ncbi:hypothetical protein K435DRAFT_526350 [Dendrothele bispora CBS 962.96]|uniref:Uncharacterized protein n=1 Tax=Dendrothele bispora (strain CBS 962.96) TaxID=1314807 RepID=A0A4S8M8Q9_DENBC|nr:hypothetical protein K435DRAFT_526350 [Dendrothele bispora CBS 962.96]